MARQQSTSPSSAQKPRPFYPPNDAATHNDLLLFEERLKTTAALLQRRKARYQLFLLQLLLLIAFLLLETVLPPPSSLLAWPYTRALRRLRLLGPAAHAAPHPYVASSLLFVSVTTLVLFFASGMYSEKIAYANQYVPHANRALRSFNMYLNVRRPAARSKTLAMLFPRPSPPHPPPPRSPAPRRPEPESAVPIPAIPPASSARGELIFSSRVHRAFREAYERHRAAFERRRARAHAAVRGLPWWRRWWRGAGEKGAGRGRAEDTAAVAAAAARARGARSRQTSPLPDK